MSKLNRYSSRRQQVVPAAYHIEELESKILLAGNVTVGLSGQNLLIRGDGLDNTVEITVLGGNAVVRGLNDTTVNGGTDLFEVVSGDNTINGSLSIQMANGNDTVLFSRGVEFIGPAVVQGNEGDDNIGSTGARFRDNLFIFGHGGDDTISLQDTQVTGAVFIRGKSGDDTVSFQDSVFDDRVKILTDFGDDAVVLERTDIAGKLSIFTSVGADDVSITDSEVFGQVNIGTASSSDFVNFDGTRFGSNVLVNMGSSDDSVLVQNANIFDGILGITSGDGNGDAVEIEDTNTFSMFQFAIKTEFSTVGPPDGSLSAPRAADRLDNPVTGALTRATEANDLFTNLLVTNTQDLVIDTSGLPGVVQSNGTLVTKNASIDIMGTTTANSTVVIDADGDGDFDDGMTLADAEGAFSLSAALTHDDVNNGVNVISVRSTDETGSEQTDSVNVHRAIGSVIRFDSTLGTYDVELLDDDAPNTVANFKGYLNRYVNSIVHRSPSNFVVQGGGFVAANGAVTAIVTDPPILNEFDPANSNERSTLSMAQLGGNINSGTSQWFFNIVDNLSLDNVPHTVFGRVIGEGMDIVDLINGLPIFNVNSFFGQSALGETPLTGYQEFTVDLTGTVTVSPGSSLVTGTGTLFTQELADTQSGAGLEARIRIAGQEFSVVAINSDTSLTLSSVHPTGATDVTAQANAQPEDAQFVRYSTISEILDTV